MSVPSQITCWMDLAAQLDAWSKRGSLMFRGVSNASFDLVPKIGRPDTRQGERPYSYELEVELFHTFKAHARPYTDISQENGVEWLVLAQHHGLPTRLLDWTLSPLVAAYFAVEQMGVGGLAAIYAATIPGNKLEIVTTGDPFSLPEMSILPPRISPRIGVQRGLLTVHPSPEQPYIPEGMEKVLIDKTAGGAIKGLLANFGISRGTLFPGIDGVADDLRWELKWRWRSQEELGHEYLKRES